MEEVRAVTYDHLDWLEVQFSQRTGCSASRQTEKATGPHLLIAEAQSGTSENHPESGGTGNVDHTAFPLDAHLAPPPLHGYA